MSIFGVIFFFSSNRRHQSYDVHLKVNTEDYQNCAVMCCAWQLYAMIVAAHKWAVLTVVWVCLGLFSVFRFLYVLCVHFWMLFFCYLPSDWLGSAAREWPILCRPGRQTLTQSANLKESGSYWRMVDVVRLALAVEHLLPYRKLVLVTHQDYWLRCSCR